MWGKRNAVDGLVVETSRRPREHERDLLQSGALDVRHRDSVADSGAAELLARAELVGDLSLPVLGQVTVANGALQDLFERLGLGGRLERLENQCAIDQVLQHRLG